MLNQKWERLEEIETLIKLAKENNSSPKELLENLLLIRKEEDKMWSVNKGRRVKKLHKSWKTNEIENSEIHDNSFKLIL